MARDKGRFAFRASAEEVEMLDRLASADGVSLSDAARIAIKREHEARFGVTAVRSTREVRR